MFFIFPDAPDWFRAYASHAHVMMSKMHYGVNTVTGAVSVKVSPIDNEKNFLKSLSKAPIRLPLRTKRDVMEADKMLQNPKIMEKMAKTIAKLVAYIRRINPSKKIASLISNAIVGRFDLVYFVVKRLTVYRDQEGKEASDFLNVRKCLPIYICAGISRLFENSMIEAGEQDSRYV